MALLVRPYDAARDGAWAKTFLDADVGGRWQSRRGELHDLLEPRLGLVAKRDGKWLGSLTYRPEAVADAVELSAMATNPRLSGVGSALVAELVEVVRRGGRTRIRVVTANDNLDALRFYQTSGCASCAPSAVDASRAHQKPVISLIGEHGIPLRDELELELTL